MRRVDFSRTPSARPGLRGVDGLIVLGGSMDVRDAGRLPYLRHELALIRRAAASGLPVLGICLGGQLAARALGAGVVPSRRPEVGWFRLRSGAHAFQWHSFEFGLPKGAERLDSTPACANQAFRRGSVVATQFHFEVDRRTISAWLGESSALSPRRKARIAADTGRCLKESRRLGRRWFGDFLKSL
ncbi:MAG: type 1 glutamine amidotransferase [Elusimicrobia bacterium]|nr:type 1 glutamine amidotransferase [Elusimicrobiota bacterium]